MQPKQIISDFLEIYKNKPNIPSVFFAPGRVNLIGEHTDYNNGYVLPCALSFGTYLAIRKIKEPQIKLASTNFTYTVSIPLNEPITPIEDKWVNYPLGVIKMLQEAGYKPNAGIELLFSGDIPNSAGLSSSASIELATAVALNEIFSFEIDRLELIMLSKKAENDFVGVNCGIMDQFVVGKARKKSAIFLNCGTMNYTHVPFVLKDYSLVIADTNKARKLSDSKYNERVKECEAAVEALSKHGHIGSLGEISIETFNEHKNIIEDEIIRKRATHVVSEDKRVLEAVKALYHKDIDKFGQLMNESHASLRDDYEVTGFELDSLVEAAQEFIGTIGARMTGAGFGGCTVNIVAKSSVDEFKKFVAKRYKEKTGLVVEFYLPEISGGARHIP